MKNGKKISSYRAQVYVRGVRLADRSFETPLAAYAWHEKEKERLLAGEPEVEAELSFEGCLKRFLEEAMPRLRLSSQQSWEVRLPYLQGSPLSVIPMKRLNSKALDTWVGWLLKHPSAKNPGRRSFAFELKFLSVVLNWYKNYVDADFVIPITKRHREMTRYKEIKSRRPDYFAKPEEIQQWIAWLAEHRKPVYSRLARFMVLTGARVSEATGLLWDAVDLERGCVRVFRRIHWDHYTRRPNLEETTKTDDSARVILLPASLVAMLKEMKSESRGEGPVFESRKGGLLKYNAIQSAFNAGFKALELPWRSTHICRHTYATLALLATRDIGSVQASLGHKNSRVTEKYAKVVALLSTATAEKTAALMNIPDHPATSRPVPENHTRNHTRTESPVQN